ncbi:ABC transporter ATP-binding protein [Pseudorhodobacter sp. MZDSW-24AT]|uniref:ABC transporter ATP-binding protein n=1 Tax=Pseudorhodobacter sp. MZDSW-24AT TaxID=2052957 RepID=UPI000C1E4DDE|nr:ABC transporter ATP-binding protein [Pseudorhodobacter sp. MZDSW-24AT]PJF08537.1 ABC transporter ATP-binding protein [Pseudorhodobacter sp. MZDSW-24AT]
MAHSPAALSLTGLTKRFGKTTAVNDISIDIREGEFFTIVGPSGSGKSSLVRLLAGLDAPSAGRLTLRGQDITETPANRRPTAMVFQSLALFDHRTVGQNIEFAMKMKGVAPEARRARALELLRLVRLPEDYYPRPVTQCSGGERQRVALARALGSDPEILFFDEPLSAIDYRLRKTLEVELKELHQRTGKTFIYITHSLEEAMVMSDRIAIMRAGQFEQIGTPEEIYRRPMNRFVASFMGEVNILTVQQQGGATVFADLELPAPDAKGTFAVLRPEALSCDAEGTFCFDAHIVQKLMLGSRTQFHLRAGTATLIAEVAAGHGTTLRIGDTARFSFDPTDIVWVNS